MNAVEFIEALAQEAHTYCTNYDHEYTQHLPTCTAYAKELYSSGYTPAQIIKTIWTLGNKEGEWQGHPYPEQVLEALDNGS